MILIIFLGFAKWELLAPNPQKADNDLLI